MALQDPLVAPNEALVAAAIEKFACAVRKAYGCRLVDLVLFGSRARGDARPDSDIDIAVVLSAIDDQADERNRLADLAYDIVSETGIELQPLPLSEADWIDPNRHRNASLIREIYREGRALRS